MMIIIIFTIVTIALSFKVENYFYGLPMVILLSIFALFLDWIDYQLNEKKLKANPFYNQAMKAYKSVYGEFRYKIFGMLVYYFQIIFFVYNLTMFLKWLF